MFPFIFADYKEHDYCQDGNIDLTNANEIGNETRASECEYLLTIFTEPQFVSMVFDIMDGYGLQKYYSADGSQNRRVNNMYVYQKSLS